MKVFLPIRSWHLFLLTAVLLFTAACTAPIDTPTPTTAVPVTATGMPPTDPPPPTATFPPTDIPSTPTPAINQELAILPQHVYVYPVAGLYAGDEVTVQLLADVPDFLNPAEVPVEILLDGERLHTGTLNGRILGGAATGIYEWVWDTSTAVGPHTLEFIIDPQDQIQIGDANTNDNRHTLAVEVQPDTRRSLPETKAEWITRETDYAFVHVIAATAAERDLAKLTQAVDNAVQTAATRLQEQPRRKFDIYFIDRVIGQGGYAGSAIVATYTDRNYAGGGLEELLVHEVVHLLDRQFVTERLSFLAEGLAIWVTGGHYKQENLDARAAALVITGRYVPLNQLINDFYPVQHEIGYLQAGAFLHHLVERFGWPAVRAFYMDVDSSNGALTPADAIDVGLQTHFGESLAQVEENWLATLTAVEPTPADINDLETTVRFYDTMRAYQMAHDPTAHFLIAWLPQPQELRARSLTADLNRHPTGELNLTLETMLTEADAALRRQDYGQADLLLDSVERVLQTGTFNDPLAGGYREIVRQTTEWGYQVHRIDMQAGQATAYVTNPYAPRLFPVEFSRGSRGWIMIN